LIVSRSEHFKKSYKKLPEEMRTLVEKALRLFLNNPQHPSLHNKKMEGTEGIWEIRVTRDYRITYEKIEGGVFLRKLGTHHILNRP